VWVLIGLLSLARTVEVRPGAVCLGAGPSTAAIRANGPRFPNAGVGAAPATSVRSMVIADMDEIEVRLLREHAIAPERSRLGDAGYDLACCEAFELEPGAVRMVGTGFALALPAGIVGLVCPRSGLAVRDGVSVLNAPGVIDRNFRGELQVVLVNHGAKRFSANAGDRIAQLVLTSVWTPAVKLVDRLSASPDDRGEHGFGSSGR
jgi:dUTP pyrophosphatase